MSGTQGAGKPSLVLLEFGEQDLARKKSDHFFFKREVEASFGSVTLMGTGRHTSEAVCHVADACLAGALCWCNCNLNLLASSSERTL